MTPTEIKAAAFDEIIRMTEKSVDTYMSRRPRADEMADWSKEELRSFFLDLIEDIESLEYTVNCTIEGQENRDHDHEGLVRYA